MADARRFGFDAATLAALQTAIDGRQAMGFSGVHLANAPVVEAFLAGASQWRTALVPGERFYRTRFFGLDYAGVKVALDALGMTITPSLWAGVMMMETAAVAALNGE